MSLILNSHVCTLCKRKGFIWQNKEHAHACKTWFLEQARQKERETLKSFMETVDLSLLPRVLWDMVFAFYSPAPPQHLFLSPFEKQMDHKYRFTLLRHWDTTLLGVWVSEEREEEWPVYGTQPQKHKVLVKKVLLCVPCQIKEGLIIVRKKRKSPELV